MRFLGDVMVIASFGLVLAYFTGWWLPLSVAVVVATALAWQLVRLVLVVLSARLP